MIVVNGIDEKRVREICQEFKEYTLKEVAQTASETANTRIEKLETILVPRITNIENGVSSLCDPEFFSLLKRIQLSAAESNRESDYEMLSELLCHRAYRAEFQVFQIGQTVFAKSVSDGGKTSNFAPKSAVNGLVAPNSVAVNSRTGRAKHLYSI